MINLRVTSFDGREIIATNPENVNDTFRQRHSVAPKRASDGSTLTNVRNEFSLNRVVDLPGIVEGARAPVETLSVKLTISGSTQSAFALEQAVNDMFFNAKRAIAAKALKGFVLQPGDTENAFVFDSSNP